MNKCSRNLFGVGTKLTSRHVPLQAFCRYHGPKPVVFSLLALSSCSLTDSRWVGHG